MPGMKDYISVTVDEKCVHQQTYLVLRNLQGAAFQKFRKCFPRVSKFAALRPKECVIAGASGTYPLCLGLYHSSEC